MKPNGFANGLVVICAGSIAACASVPREADGLAAGPLVHFTESSSRGSFTISCRPRSEAIGKTAGWVDICNELGQAALKKAADDGLIAPVTGLAFGMASGLMKSMPPDAPVNSRVIARDFPIIGTAL